MNMKKLIKKDIVCGITDERDYYTSLNEITTMPLGDAIDMLSQININISLVGGWDSFIHIDSLGEVEVRYSRYETDIEYMNRQEKEEKQRIHKSAELSKMKLKYDKMVEELKKQEEKIAKYQEYIDKK